MPPGDASTAPAAPTPSPGGFHQLLATLLLSGLKGAQLLEGVGLLFLLCLTCPQHVLTCSSQTNSVTSFRWLLKCHLLEQPQLVPTQPRTSGHSWFHACKHLHSFRGLSLSSRSCQAQQWGSELSGAHRTNGWSWCLNAPVPSSLGGWVSLTSRSNAASWSSQWDGAQVPTTQGLSSLPPSSVSCHPTPLPTWGQVLRTTAPRHTLKGLPCHHICRKLTWPRKICPYLTPGI